MSYGNYFEGMTLTQIQIEINKLVNLVNQMTGTLYSSILIDDINELLIKGYHRAQICDWNELECFIVFSSLIWNKYDNEPIHCKVAITRSHPYIQIPEESWYTYRERYPNRYCLSYYQNYSNRCHVNYSTLHLIDSIK